MTKITDLGGLIIDLCQFALRRSDSPEDKGYWTGDDILHMRIPKNLGIKKRKISTFAHLAAELWPVASEVYRDGRGKSYVDISRGSYSEQFEKNISLTNREEASLLRR